MAVQRGLRYGVVLILAGCGGPLSTLDPAGPVAREIGWLWWAMLAGAAAITLLVGVLLALAFSRRKPALGERVWTLGLGVAFSMAVLGALLAAGIAVGERILPRAGEAAVAVSAHARQWHWEFRQPGPDGQEVVTRDRLYIPAGRTVVVSITAEDVIHSFWVPRLAGKMDAIPGHTNRLRLIASAPGRYDGLCAEFCGTGHAFMRFEVIAYPPDAPPPIEASR